jgi:hypothetical protein
MVTAARLARWDVDSVYWSTLTASDSGGAPTWSVPALIRGRLDRVRQRSVVNGEEKFVWTDTFDTSVAITEGDRIWPPGADHTDQGQSAVRLGKVPVVRSRDGTSTVRYQATLGGV